jgi:hypothetical protein
MAHLVKPSDTRLASSFVFQARGACRSLYRAWRRRSTLCSWPTMVKPGGYCTYTSSASSPLRNADFTLR